MPGERVVFRDKRSGRFRRAEPWEKNKFFTVDTLSKGLAQFKFKTYDRMGEALQKFADEMVTYARNNAPWDDRTGAARQGLESEAILEDDGLTVTLEHTAEYGIFLELRWGGRYAIIIPTVETMGPKLFSKMNNMMSEIVYYD